MNFIVNLNNKNYKYFNPISIIDIIKNIYIKEDRYKYIAAYVNNKIEDLRTIINSNINLELININDKESNNIINRSSAFIMGYSIKKIWPNSKLLKAGITNKNFFYDVYINEYLSIENINLLEKFINNIFLKNLNIYRKKIFYKDIKKIFYKTKEKYKILLLKTKYKNKYTYNLYYCDDYYDNCLGINVINTKFLKKINLIKKIYQVWYGDKINKVVYRIYGNLLEFKNENYTKKLIYNKKNDHRNINKNKNLYFISEKSPGMIYWNNNGLIIYNELIKYIREILIINNYNEVKTPIIMEKLLWEKTGHTNFFSKNIFNLKIDNKKYYVKPMNCPGHVNIFNQGIKSYRDLPYKISEFGNCHRNEPSGSLHGLMRVRNFCQDDSHIFCEIKQIELVINDSIKIMYEIYSKFNFKDIKIQLSTRPEKKIGEDFIWDSSEKIILKILNKNKISFSINKGEGAFYGPKIEFVLLDSLDKLWQCGTIQLDFFLSKNLNATYIDSNNLKKNPIIIHRAILGSIERFVGIITEHYSGKYPLWLSPIQIVLINITINQCSYVLKLLKIFIKLGLRAKSDIRNKTLNYKIREHVKNNIPYIIICGEKEKQTNKISVRTCDGKNLGLITISKFTKEIINLIKKRKENKLINEVYY